MGEIEARFCGEKSDGLLTHSGNFVPRYIQGLQMLWAVEHFCGPRSQYVSREIQACQRSQIGKCGVVKVRNPIVVQIENIQIIEMFEQLTVVVRNYHIPECIPRQSQSQRVSGDCWSIDLDMFPHWFPLRSRNFKLWRLANSLYSVDIVVILLLFSLRATSWPMLSNELRGILLPPRWLFERSNDSRLFKLANAFFSIFCILHPFIDNFVKPGSPMKIFFGISFTSFESRLSDSRLPTCNGGTDSNLLLSNFSSVRFFRLYIVSSIWRISPLLKSSVFNCFKCWKVP